ncbi:MAG: DUF488 domain-containing protein [Fimbriimonadaceae bacterium]|nr:DUF488 domain-containing protein [Fimbriimonadaceae bacterium]
MRLFTIGFTQSSAEHFFERLRAAGVRRVVDVRLNNSSQLAGFAKGGDLPYFLQAIAGIAYAAEPRLAPTAAILDAYKKGGGDWSVYEAAFGALLVERAAATVAAAVLRDGDCLLCSEATPEHCHRRLVAEYVAAQQPEVEVVHL